MFNIQGLPMFILFDQGKPVATHSGALNKTKLREFIESNLVTRKNIDA
jgi:thioredoxin-like negative regulator of GroEL